MRNTLKNTLLAILLFVFSIAAYADSFKGRVIDAETGEPLTMANVHYRVNFSEQGYSESDVSVDSAGYFLVQPRYSGRIVLTFMMIGYKRHRVVNYVYGDQGELDLGDIKLQPTALMLGEVAVTAKARRVTMSGDTIVFNPNAFNLRDGDRLADLIRKLPGVQKDKDGKLTWNGKPIRLMVNGKDVFGGDGVLEQLPYEAAGKLKLYDRKSEQARHTGKTEGDEDNVLDIQVKPGFLDKWYGDIEGHYMTENHYLGKLMASRLSDKNPQAVFFKINNINEKVDLLNGSWNLNYIDNFGKGLFGAYRYQNFWKTKGCDRYKPNSVDVGLSLGHNDGWATEYQTNETFFPNSDNTFTSTISQHYTHSLKPQLQAQLFAYTDARNYVHLNLVGSYDKRRETNETTLEQLQNDQLVTQANYYKSSDADQKQLFLVYDWMHFLSNRGSFTLSGYTSLDATDATSHVNRQYDYLRENLADKLWQRQQDKTRKYETQLQFKFQYWLGSKVLLEAYDRIRYTRGKQNGDVYADSDESNVVGGNPTTVDADNLMRYDSHRWHNEASAAFLINLSKTLSLTPMLRFHTVRERGNMLYGSLDSTRVRTLNYLAPYMKVQWRPKRSHSLTLTYSYEKNTPSLFDMFGWRNTTDPLNVQLGNPLLECVPVHDVKLNYIRMWLRQQTNLSFTGSYQRYVNPVATLYRYNTLTGAYTTMPINTKDSEFWEVSMNYDQGIGPDFRLKNIATLRWGQSYGFLTQMDDDTSDPVLNKKKLTYFTDDFELSYETDNVKMSLCNTLSYARHRYSDESYNNNPLHIKYGGKLDWKLSSFRLVLGIYDDFYSGYASSGMNRHHCLAGATVSYTFLKNKCIVALKANDIFNNNKTFDVQYNGYQRQETWSKQFGHYYGVSVYYKFDAKAKKR